MMMMMMMMCRNVNVLLVLKEMRKTSCVFSSVSQEIRGVKKWQKYVH